MLRINDRDVVECLCRLHCDEASAVCQRTGNGDMDDVVCVNQLLCEEFLHGVDIRRTGDDLLALILHIAQQTVRVDLHAVHEAALLRVDEVRQHADAVAFDELRRQVGNAFRGDRHRFFPLILLHPRDRFLQYGLLRAGHEGQILRQQAVKLLFEHVAGDRLGQIAVKALLFVKRTVIAAGICGQRHDLRFLAETANLAADRAQAFNAVHLRHEVIHEDDMITLIQRLFQGFLTAGDRVGLHLGGAQQLGNDQQIGGVVIHDQHPCFGRLKLRGIFAVFAGNPVMRDLDFADLLCADDLLRDLNDEGRALGVDAVDRDPAAHQIDKLLDDRKTETGAFDVAVLLLVHAPERVEQERDVLLLDADAGIADGVDYVEDAVFRFAGLHRERHGAAVGIFDGVVQHVNENLLDADLVAEQLCGNLRRDIHLKIQPLLLRTDPQHPDDIREHIARVIGGRRELHLAGGEFGHIENIVDKVQQHLACGLDVCGVLRHLLGDILAQDHFIERDDRVDRRADLVAHAGEKVVLCLAQRLDLLFLPAGALHLMIIEQVAEADHDAHAETDQNERAQGVDMQLFAVKLEDAFRCVIRGKPADKCLRKIQQQIYDLDSAVQTDIDIENAEQEPQRCDAADAAAQEKEHRCV